MYLLVAKIVDLQLKKLELKMNYFDDIEAMMDRERAQVLLLLLLFLLLILSYRRWRDFDNNSMQNNFPSVLLKEGLQLLYK
jgi:hypothetical protein